MLPRLLCGLALIAAATLHAQETPIAFTGATIIPITGEPIEHGVLLVQDGKITAVGDARTVRLSSEVQIVDATGKVIMPGLIDSHSHIGGGSGGDSSSPIQPETRVLDSVNVRDPRFQKTRNGGITTVNVMPGSGHLISGQTLYLKLREARVIDDLLITMPDGTIAGGLKMANGTNPLSGKNGFPGTRAKSVALVRDQFIKAREYKEKLAKAGDDESKRPERNLALEELVEVLDGKRIVQHHTHRHDDIITVLRLAKEFGFKVALHHVSDGWKVAPEIAAAGVPCSIIALDAPGGKIEARDISFKTGRVLEEAGVTVGMHTDDGVTDSRFFIRSAALMVRGGMSRDGALRALTLANAEILGLADRIGSLESGKDADFIILSGDPFSTYTHVEQTWVEGRKVFDRANEKDHIYAVGGPGAGHPQSAYLCCFGDSFAHLEQQ